MRVYYAPYVSNYAYTYPASVAPVASVQPVSAPWVNNLKEMFHKRQAVTYALLIRTFAAEDKNHNGKIEPQLGENGTFLKAIKLLPQLKALGVNNLHILPITPSGVIGKPGEPDSPGSAYAPAAYDRVSEELAEPGVNLSVVQQARMFVDACHQLGIHVMLDVPSCASIDLTMKRPDLMSQDAQGHLLSPGEWRDIRMFVNDSPELRQFYQKFFDMAVNQLNVDGFRVDVARARTRAFWQHFIGQYPDKAWLAESYTSEDASPMKNMARDIPEDLSKVGFDAIYGQFHIFSDINANQFEQYLRQNEAMLKRVGPEKSIIASYETHDDPSAMEHGGVLYCKLVAAMMCVTPNTTPYILDGFTTGYTQPFDVFNWRPKPQGIHPEIGQFLKRMLAIRQSAQYGPVLTMGHYVPLPVEQDQKDPNVIAYIRKFQNKTVLILANKDVNAIHDATIEIPGLKAQQKLVNLAPTYGQRSMFKLYPGELEVKLAPGRFYMFDLNLQ